MDNNNLLKEYGVFVFAVFGIVLIVGLVLLVSSQDGSYVGLATGSVCGNGVRQAGEQCDDGNTNNNDVCLNTCRKAKCGDTFIRSGVEQCDDGNTINGDGCSKQCKVEVCGNGVKEGVEECDDGNTNNYDNCLNNCVSAKCGDGFKRPPSEQCDDGNTNNVDLCLSTCKKTKCGDGFVQSPNAAGQLEECDDTNLVGGDGCSYLCKNEVAQPMCGNGVKEGAEECDDGNAVLWDGCSLSCKLDSINTGTGDGKIYRVGGVDVDSAGNIYAGEFSEFATYSIKKFNQYGEFLAKFGAGTVYRLYDIELDNLGNFYILNLDGNPVKKFGSDGRFLGQIGITESGWFLRSIATDSSGNLYVGSDKIQLPITNPHIFVNSRIQKYDSNGNLIDTFSSFGDGNGQFKTPISIAVDNSGNVYVVSSGKSGLTIPKVNKFGSNWNFLGTFTSQGLVSTTNNALVASNVGVDNSGNVYILNADILYKFGNDGSLISSITGIPYDSVMA